MSQREKSTIIVTCWLLLMIVGSAIVFIPDSEGIIYLVYIVSLIHLGKKLESLMEHMLRY